MALKAKAKRAGLDEREAQDLKLLEEVLGFKIKSIHVVPPEEQEEPKRRKVFNYDE